MFLVVKLDIGTQQKISVLSHEPNKLAFLLFLMVVGLLLIINLVRYNKKIKRLEKDSIIEE
jgi:hypothetical protein